MSVGVSRPRRQKVENAPAIGGPLGRGTAANYVRSHVGHWGISGLVMLMLSFVDTDPLRKSGVPKCCDAQHGFSTMW
jgi:hypothetical protein